MSVIWRSPSEDMRTARSAPVAEPRWCVDMLDVPEAERLWAHPVMWGTIQEKRAYAGPGFTHFSCTCRREITLRGATVHFLKNARCYCARVEAEYAKRGWDKLWYNTNWSWSVYGQYGIPVEVAAGNDRNGRGRMFQEAMWGPAWVIQCSLIGSHTWMPEELAGEFLASCKEIDNRALLMRVYQALESSGMDASAVSSTYQSHVRDFLQKGGLSGIRAAEGR